MYYTAELTVSAYGCTEHHELASFTEKELSHYTRIINRLHRLIAHAIDSDNFDCLRNDPAAKQFPAKWLCDAACAGFLGYCIEIKPEEQYYEELRARWLAEKFVDAD